MKTVLLLHAFLLSALVGLAQDTHTLTATDHIFTPDTLYIQPGDTIELVNIGYHSATEVDYEDWANNVSNHNGGFFVGVGAPTFGMKFTIDTEGTYYNICEPHAAMGMKSVIIVGSETIGIDDLEASPEPHFYPNPATQSITVQHATSVSIYDLSGKAVLETKQVSELEEIDISFLPAGIYHVILDNRREKLVVE